MTQDEIIRMAREAGMTVFVIESLERFAALVAAHERERMWCDAEFARQQEREACAKVCEEYHVASEYPGYVDCAAAIRARNEK